MRAVISVKVAIRVDSIGQRLGQHPDVADPIGVENANGHDLGVGRGQHHQASDMGAMTIGGVLIGIAFFAWVVIHVNKVVAPHQATGKGGMTGVNARVKDGHSNAGAARDAVGGRQVHLWPGPLLRIFTSAAAGPFHPLATFRRLFQEIRFGILDATIAGQRIRFRLRINAVQDTQAVDGPGAKLIQRNGV